MRVWSTTLRSLQKVFNWLVAGCTALVGLFNFGGAISTAWTMLVSLVFYAAAFGWRYALGFVLLLLAHELGHVIAVRAVGMYASAPIFIPFVGAVVNLRQAPHNAKMEANIAIGGPALGTIAALTCVVLYLWTDSRLLLLLAYTGCLLNLFNLIPCSPLDGGKIVKAISRKMWLVGIVMLLGVFIMTSNPFLLLILVLGAIKLFQSPEEESDYYRLSPRVRFKVAVWYFILIAVLSSGTAFSYGLL